MKDQNSLRVLNLLPERGDAGAQNVAKEITALLNSHGWQSKLAYLDDFQIDFNNIGSLSIFNALQKLRALVNAWRWLGKEKKSGQWDLVVSHIDRADWLNAFTHAPGTKSVIYSHGSKRADVNYKGLKGRFRKLLTYVSYHRADRVICVSEGLRKELVEDGFVEEAHTTTIYNWLDVENTLQKSQEQLPEAYQLLTVCPRPIFTSVGRLAEQKQPDALVKAFKLADFSVTHPILIFVGDGEMYDELYKLACSLGLNVCAKNETPNIDLVEVIFTGFRSNPLPFTKIATSFVTTSIWEGLPLAIIEALVLGKHVIANDCPHGPSELTQLANSLVVPEVATRAKCLKLTNGLTNIEAFTEELEGRIREPDDWCIDEETMRETFSRNTAVRKIQAVFQEIFEGE